MTNPATPRTKGLNKLLALGLLVPLAACGAGQSGDSDEYQADSTYAASAADVGPDADYAENQPLPTAAAPAEERSEDGDSAEYASEDTVVAGSTANAAPANVAAPANIDASRAIVIIAAVDMHADDVATAAADVIDLVTASGGHVDSRSIINDDPEGGTRGSARLTARVPPADAEGFIGQLESIAPVDAINQEATDVTDQLTDLDIRIENAKASLDRIRALMQQATRIDDLTSLEYELSNRQVNLEQLEAQKASIGKDVAMATIRISIRSTADLDTGPVAPSDVSLVGAAKAGWRGLVEVVYSVLLVVVTLWPIVLLALAAAFVVKRVHRRRKSSRGDGPDSTTPDEPTADGTGSLTPQPS